MQIAKEEFNPDNKIDDFLEYMGVNIKCSWTKEQSEEAWKKALKVLKEVGEHVVVDDDR